MAKKPDLQTGEYGIKVGYLGASGRKYVWFSQKFSSIEDAEEYIEWENVGYSSDNCTDVAIVDWNGTIVGGFIL